MYMYDDFISCMDWNCLCLALYIMYVIICLPATVVQIYIKSVDTGKLAHVKYKFHASCAIVYTLKLQMLAGTNFSKIIASNSLT